MCGIAGIITKGASPGLGMTTGKALTEMMHAIVHRGPDSAGWALYRESLQSGFRMRFFISEGAEGAREAASIRKRAESAGATPIEESLVGCTYALIADYRGNPTDLALSMQKSSRLMSFGRSVDIVKDVGQPRGLAEVYGIKDFNGTHGIGHTRLATESAVFPETSHPFWATGFADVSVVHNGQLTNYWVMRRRLQREGMIFDTENDTELVAVYLAYRMSRGDSLEQALASSLDDLDGTFSYLVATADSLGYAKDKLAAKPLIKYEDEEIVALASEEVALNRLFPGRTLRTEEMPPLTYGLWSYRKETCEKGVAVSSKPTSRTAGRLNGEDTAAVAVATTGRLA
ncbi:MAG: amidophosphoribosyltransferase [Actinobacteria bacterium]|nr:amidophosphoribosyltransferase [Actinomycetota bacterium]